MSKHKGIIRQGVEKAAVMIIAAFIMLCFMAFLLFAGWLAVKRYII